MYSKRKKVVRQRGKTTHGYGSMKKNRGAGHRGGRGNAGSGKRGDAKKPSVWKNKAKKGFVKKGKVITHICINVGKLDSLSFDKEGDAYLVDLSKLGCNKLLGSGTVKNKYKVLAKYASARAIEKIKNAGGEVIVD